MANSLWIGFRPLTGISLIFYGHIPNDSSSQCSGFRPLTGISLIFYVENVVYYLKESFPSPYGD